MVLIILWISKLGVNCETNPVISVPSAGGMNKKLLQGPAGVLGAHRAVVYHHRRRLINSGAMFWPSLKTVESRCLGVWNPWQSGVT